MEIVPKIVQDQEIAPLRNLSTEKLIIWIIGKSKEFNLKITPEDIILECWLINPDKHSLRGYSQFPDSATVQKRIGEMKGKKGLLVGSEMSGYSLTELSKPIYADIVALVFHNKLVNKKRYTAADRNISSMDEAPYKRLKKTPAYEKYKTNHFEQIVETDFLYFYGINWHSKKSVVHNRIKNVDAVVYTFSKKDEVLKEVHKFLNKRFNYIRKQFLEE